MSRLALAWAMAGVIALGVPAVIAQDNLDGAWASPFGGLHGTARASFPVIFPPGGEYEVAWMLDPGDPEDPDFYPPANASQIVFDAEGNLYWHSQGHWSPSDHVASCTPAGVLRWVGPPGGIGDMQSDLTPIVGQSAVYMIGMFDPAERDEGDPCQGYTAQQIFSLDKSDGSPNWVIKLNNEPYCPEGPFPITNNAQPNPILYDGRLFVMGLPDVGRGVAVYQIDAANGTILGNNIVTQLDSKMCGNTCLVPNKFGTGIHGLYVLMYESTKWPPVTQVFGLAVDTNTNTTAVVWQSSPSKNGAEVGPLDSYTWAHVMYNATNDRIYVYSDDNSLGYEMFSFSALTGDDWKGWGDSGSWWLSNGQYQTGALDFDDTTIITGANDGGFVMYTDDGAGNVSFTDNISHLTWDQPRQFVQLLYDSDTESTVAVTGTSGIGTGMTHIMMCDLDDRSDPAEDGPLYIDDIEVYQGPDLDNLTLVWSEDFEGYSAGSPPGGSWMTLYGYEQPEPIVVDDPTGGGHGKVLELDPVAPPDPDDPNNVWGHGAYHPLTQTTGNVIVTKYKQWMQDTSEVYEVMWGSDETDYTRGFAYGNDWDSRRCTLEWLDSWNQPNYQVDQVWEDVVYTYDHAGETSAVAIADRDEVSSSWYDPGTMERYPFAPDASAAGFGVTMWHGDISDNYSRMRVNHLFDVRYGWQQVNALGGPLVGPDGKIYFFETRNASWLPPDEHPGWLFAIQPKTPYALGDLNCDGAVNGFDIDHFIQVLNDWDGYIADHDGDPYPPCDPWLADVNQDGAVNGFDIDAFVAVLSG
ncbi:MAG: hypothetical protein KKB50_15620 [Planctomycetes bacterium]|nr:hypothetical protein [Planctomycetota bacterium]